MTASVSCANLAVRGGGANISIDIDDYSPVCTVKGNLLTVYLSNATSFNIDNNITIGIAGNLKITFFQQ